MLPPENVLPYHLFIRFAVLYIFSQRESQRKVQAFIIPQGAERFERSQENIVSNKQFPNDCIQCTPVIFIFVLFLNI